MAYCIIDRTEVTQCQCQCHCQCVYLYSTSLMHAVLCSVPCELECLQQASESYFGDDRVADGARETCSPYETSGKFFSPPSLFHTKRNAAIACSGDVREVGKPSSNGRTDVPHGQYVCDGEVAHDGAPNDEVLFAVAVDHRRHEHRHAAHPRQRIELLPEPRHYHRHVEAENKCDRNQVVVALAVGGQVVEIPVSTYEEATGYIVSVCRPRQKRSR